MILMIDNYDSFTYNLVQLLTSAGAEVEVRRNDVAPVDELLALEPEGIVVSPGPGRPEDAGISVDLFRSGTRVPILGVCLGHQSLGLAFGARVELSPEIMHGKTSPVRHDGSGLFSDLPNPFEATRYHSLEVPEDSLPPELVPVAWAESGNLMAMHHADFPYWGVQFHPESVLTGAGPHLMENFLDLCHKTSDGGAS